jgi:hypothetical protein
MMVMALDRTGAPVKDVPITFQAKGGGGVLQVVDQAALVYTSDQITTIKTNYNGIAKINIALGTDISANPTSRYDTPYPQPVGENIVEVYTESGLQTNHPLTAFAFPDVPDHIEITGGGNNGPILTWADTVIARVVDQHGNPISNQEVNFTIGDPVEKLTCNKPNADSTKGALVKISNSCLNNNIPAYGDCLPVTQSITEITSDIGAAVQVILGGVPDADYPVTISYDGLDPVTVTVTSLPFGNCDGDSPPQYDLILKDISLTDGLGNIINAAPLGGTIPVTARMYMLSELSETVQKTLDCIPSGTDTCPMVIGTREYNVDTSFTASSVTFDQIAAIDVGGKVFEIQDFPVGDTPGKRTVTISGTAAKTTQETTNACSNRDDCSLVTSQYDLPAISITKDIYAIDITLAAPEVVIPINSDGYATGDTVLNYTILPAEYVAGSAMVEIVKKNQDGSTESLRYLDSERSGDGFVTLARGFRFEPDSEYIARVVLNRGSNATEIVSKEMVLRPIALDLRADIDRNGNITNEDDLQETMGNGLVVPMNNDDDDGDQVIDREDDNMVDAAGLPVDDNDLIEVGLNSLPATLAEGTVILEVIQGQEQIRIWDSREKQNLLVDSWIDGTDPSRQNPTKQWIIGTDVANIGELPKTLFVEGVKETDPPDNHVVLAIKYLSAGKQEFEADRLHVTVVRAAIVPDYDRNGLINDDDRNKVTEEQPWRFWVNDDSDGGADSAGIGGSGDDLPGQNKDNSDNQVNTIRDLLDFFPLYLDLGNALQLWPHADGYRYVLSDKAALTTNDIKLGLFEGSAALTSDKVYGYLEELAVSDQFSATEVKAVDAEGMELSAQFLDSISASDKNGIILVEGRASTVSPLILEISKDGQVVHSVSFPLEIVPVEQMFGHKDLRGIAGATDGDLDRFVDFTDQTRPEYFANAKQPYCMHGTDKNLIWMHGYNVDPEAARSTYAEVFKRFFHAGLTGRFYGVSWFGNPRGHFANPTAAFSPHYHQAVVNAFATAGAYVGFINSVPGSTSIAAHSLGNMVAGEAIQNGLTVNNYFAVDAAVALEAYGDIQRDTNGQVSLNPDMANVEDWPDYIAAGQSRLLASEWHRLFSGEPLGSSPVYPPATPPLDKRTLLTWRGRFANIPGLNVYNFYSKTEDVLRTYPGDNLLWDGAGANLGMFSWGKQEKFKGRRDRIGDVPQIGMDVGGASSNYCGWSFNSDWNKFFGFGSKLTPQQAKDKITDDDLRSKPFFALDKWHLFTDLSSILEPNLDNLAGTINNVSSSDFVMKKVSETDLKSYYTYNAAAHDKVLVRDWLLAEAFPATTLPMGANENSLLRNDVQNVDMSGDSSDPEIECCKTSEGSWPSIREGNWWHSDYKDMPYQQVYTFYKNLTDKTN